MTTLLVEEQPPPDDLAQCLISLGHSVAVVPSAAKALLLARGQPLHMILLDPAVEDVLQTIPDLMPLAPIVVCSQAWSQRDRVVPLRLGADDVVSRPVDLQMLDARMLAVRRRFEKHLTLKPVDPRNVHHDAGPLKHWPARGVFEVGDAPLHLTPNEKLLMTYLIQHPDQVVTRDVLAEAAWGAVASFNSDHIIDVHLGRVRAKLRRASARWPKIEGVRGRGFRLRTGDAA